MGTGWKKTGNVNIHERDTAVGGFFVHCPPGVHGGGWYKFWGIPASCIPHPPWSPRRSILTLYFPLPSPTISTMKISATISPHQVKAVILHYTPHGKVVARLTFLRGRSRWPAFWPDEDWHTWCLLAHDPVGSSPCLCGPVLLVATLVVLGEIFNATLGYVYAPLPTLRFLVLRPVVPCSDSLFLFS